MDFAFDFFGERKAVQAVQVDQANVDQVKPARTVQLSDDDLREAEMQVQATLEVLVGPSRRVGLVQTRNVALEDAGSVAAERDVQVGVYEGGFKLWECAIDVARYLEAHPEVVPPGSRVLDLGCGHGLPGVVAAALGASVCFQDLNGEVLARQTVLNLVRNLPQDRASRWRADHTLVAGDWRALVDPACAVLAEGAFDLIVAAETVYAEEQFQIMHDMLVRFLAPQGVALVAAKRFYFGVGGGSRGFQDFVAAKGILEGSLERAFEDGSSNIRDLVKFRRR